MNKRLLTILILSLTLFTGIGVPAMAQSDIDEHRSCTHCGMDRKAFGYSRMLVVYEDGGKVGVCSLHCALTELDANKKRKVASLLVADRNTRSLISVEKAFWVVGGTKRGVMSRHPTWAFATKAAADEFIASYGGKSATWDEVLTIAKSPK